VGQERAAKGRYLTNYLTKERRLVRPSGAKTACPWSRRPPS